MVRKEVVAESSTQEGAPAGAGTEAARAAQRPRALINRRTFVLTGFWGSMAALGAAIVGGWGIDFLWPKKITGFGAPVDVAASKIPAPGADPVHIAEGRFWLENIPAGEAESPGGLLALYQKCPHLGCTVPWRADFDFGGKKGWFRCPCHGSTFTKEGGILVSGPSSRNMDTMAITFKPSGDIIVQTGQIKGGGQDNPMRVVSPGAQTPEGA
jgi:cytochrome b6-f complex iron-sulfur subunit